MDTIFNLPFLVLEVPNLKIKRPSWFQQPSAMVVFSVVLLSYFLVTGGIIYDVIVEPPSVGSTTDEHGHSRPVAFMPYRINGQYIMEGLASSFLFTMGGLGFIVLDRTHNPSTPKLNRILLISVGFLCVVISFVTCWIFMRMKLPSSREKQSRLGGNRKRFERDRDNSRRPAPKRYPEKESGRREFPGKAEIKNRREVERREKERTQRRNERILKEAKSEKNKKKKK